jgi:SAM-dependent methyltransferase
MKAAFEMTYHQLEKDHFWFKARRAFIIKALEGVDRNATILDIGCSSGLLLEELILIGFNPQNLYGIDISEIAINNCRNIGLGNTFVLDAQDLRFNQKFDVIIASDSLEHLEHDTQALKSWFNLLKPTGIGLIYVPAFMLLWSKHDEVNMHYRRYKKNELKTKLMQTGFEIIESGYWNFALFFPILVVRLLNRFMLNKAQESGNLNKMPWLNHLLYNWLLFENKLLKYISFPFGVSTYCIVGEKAKSPL